MKILWFSPTPAKYGVNTVRHNGGGWVVSLAELLETQNDILLAIAFEGEGNWCRKDQICYYPINTFSRRINRLRRKFSPRQEEGLLLPEMLRVVHDFKPDLIHVFGSENAFGEICRYTEVPTVIHLQGFLPAYYNAKFPPGFSPRDFYFNALFNPLKLYRFWWFNKIFRRRAEREEKIIETCSNFMGRTLWDKSIAHLYHPQANYWYCSEMLRPEFYDENRTWTPHDREKLILISIISTPIYKGQDLILKTAKLLRQYTGLDFEWKIFGISDLSFFEKKLHCSARQLNVVPLGVISAKKLKEELLNADFFIHPSYIDNSPNSLCEAQVLGMPVIATDVGGVSSLVENNQTGILVPANDPIMMAESIQKLNHKPELAVQLGGGAREVAMKRHNPKTILQQLLNCYASIMEHSSNRNQPAGTFKVSYPIK